MGNIFSNNNDNENLYKEIKTIKSQYFPIINQILKNNYDQGFNNDRIKNNMQMCLENKCFDEFSDSDEEINISYIYWLDYLYNYLSVDQNGKKWAREMIHLLDEERFLTENKYLSHFFFKEFYLNTEPNCLKDSKDDDNNDSNDEVINTSNNDIDLKVSMNNSNLNMMRNLGGTFMANEVVEVEVDNNDNNSNNNEMQAELKYKSFRNKVKKYIYIFKQHIVYKDHPINKVIQIFEKTWVKYVEEKMEILNNFDDTENDNININSTVDRLTRELQNFVIKIQVCLKLFYCRAIDFSCFSNEKDELINLLTTLVFRTGKIYETLFKLQKLKLKDILYDMEEKYSKLKGITPQQLGIEKQFCLNEETFEMQENILENEEKKIKENPNENEDKKDNLIDTDKQNSNIDKGVANFYLTDEIMEKRKIQSLLADIRNKKIKIQNYIENDFNTMKVDIDFDNDNNNLLTQSYYNRTGSMFDESNMGSILPKSRLTVDSGPNILNKNARNSFDGYMSNKENLKNNILNEFNANINDDNDNDNDNGTDNFLIVRNNNETRKTVTPFNFIKIFSRVSFVKDTDKSEFISLPYETAITLLKQIEKYKAPFEKMLIFASLGNEIKNCIDDFWKDMEDYIDNDLLGVEAEQLMTIFIYIISKAQIKDIIVHCKLIQLFTTSTTKASMIGYYYSNAEASVTFIQTLKNVKELFKGRGGIFDKNND